jgi:membrane-bound ClpP family serine protease
MTKKKEKDQKQRFALPKENYKLLLIGFAVIVIGFILMVGGKAESPEQFNPDVFSFRRITLAPLVVLLGFAFEIYAIMKKPKEDKTDQTSS